MELLAKSQSSTSTSSRSSQSRSSSSASLSVLRIGFPRELNEVLISTPQPVFAFMASRSECSQGSLSLLTVCGRAVPSKCVIAGRAAAASGFSRGAKDMKGE